MVWDQTNWKRGWASKPLRETKFQSFFLWHCCDSGSKSQEIPDGNAVPGKELIHTSREWINASRMMISPFSNRVVTVIQQLMRATCTFSLLASALLFLSDMEAGHTVRVTISSSEMILDRFQAAQDVLQPFWYYPKKYKEHHFNPLWLTSHHIQP